MPRKSRIDAPGALHHIIARGIDRQQIFKDDANRLDFINRLGKIIKESGTGCYAWALIPNHFHLLLKTGRMPISHVMLRLLTEYAVCNNRRHRRHGKERKRVQAGSLLCYWAARQLDISMAELSRKLNISAAAVT